MPSTAANFVAFDTGATAWGTLQGRMVSTATPAIGFPPDALGDWLRRTIDADTQDRYVLDKLGTGGIFST